MPPKRRQPHHHATTEYNKRVDHHLVRPSC